MSRHDYRAAAAEAEIRELAKQAKAAISTMAARSMIIEAAMRVLTKHDLLDEFSHELNHPPEPSRAILNPMGEMGEPDMQLIIESLQLQLEEAQRNAAEIAAVAPNSYGAGYNGGWADALMSVLSEIESANQLNSR